MNHSKKRTAIEQRDIAPTYPARQTNTRTDSQEPPREPSASSSPGDCPRVLVVDDEVQVLVALEDLLGHEFIVRTANSLTQALSLIEHEGDFAVVIFDQRMLEMTGDQLFGQLAEGSPAERILLTGFDDVTTVVKAVNEGRIFALVTKPWSAHELRLKVRQAAEHFRLARELLRERQLLDDLMGNISDGIYFKDTELCFLRANDPIAKLLDVPEPALLTGKSLQDLGLDPRTVEETEADERRILREGSEVVDLLRVYGEGPTRQWFSETKAPVRNSTGSVIGLVGISRNVTDRVEADHAREQQQQRIARLTRIHAMTSAINSAIVRASAPQALLTEACRVAVHEGQLTLATVIAFDEASNSFRVVAAAAAERCFSTVDDMLGRNIERGVDLFRSVLRTETGVVLNDLPSDSDAAFSQQFLDCSHRAAAAFPLRGSGAVRYVFALSSEQPGFFDDYEERLLQDLAGNISLALDHLAARAKLDFLAYYDEVTELPNQQLFLDRLTQQLTTSRNSERQLAVLMVDIDRFRQINETLGRTAGDELLRQVGQRIGSGVGQQGSLARIEGNRFAVLLPVVEDATQAAAMVEHLLGNLMNDSFDLGATEILISARFGIALYPSDGTDAEGLASNAEAALKRAKALGQRYVYYAPSMNSQVAQRLTLETKLRRALENEEFVLHYQPKIQLNQKSLVGLEALIRWRSPEGGLVAPGVFIPILEDTGMIAEVGRWVLMRAAAQYVQWVEQGLSPPRVAVNVSAIQLGQPDFLRCIEQMQKNHVLAARHLDLEITESVFVDDLEGNVKKLASARERGLQVAIDDFGTGYSSLAYLSRLPIDIIKIDRSFVSQMNKDPQDMALITTIISLAHALDCKVVAEGVETTEQAQLLRLLRCDQIQGYLISKPLPAEEICGLFSGERRPAQ